jgi:hypothetical protein
MIPIKYAYITGCLILFLFWLFIFLKRKDLRREMLWASFLGVPFGFIDFFLVPTYWNPDSLFGFIKKYGVGIESFVFLFVMAGLVSVIYDFLQKKKLTKLAHNSYSHFWLLFLTSLTFVIMSILFPAKAVYNFMIVGAVGATIIAYFRKDLRKQIFASAFVFSFLYFGVFVLINIIFKGFVEHFYNLKNTWGILILGVPLEEIGVAFFAGAFWSTIYEYTKAYREK